MKPANLLIESESFNWSDNALDRSIGIEDFMLAHNLARNYQEKKDKIFNSQKLWVLEIDGESFNEIIANYQKATDKFQWLQPDHRTFIAYQIMNYGATPNNSETLAELELETGFVEENNGLLRIGENEEESHVFDTESWYRLHINYVKRFPEHINWELNNVLPYFEYSNLHLIKVIKKYCEEIFNENHLSRSQVYKQIKEQWEALANENEMLSFFQNQLIRTFRSNTGDLVELASEISNRNGYSQNQHLSSLEAQLMKSRRLIFEIIKQEQKQYLSLDFENGLFEVCDKNGNHIGVHNFSGEPMGKADTSGSHNIRTLNK